MTDKLAPILKAKKATHGDFKDYAPIAQALKGVVHRHGHLDDMQRQALEQIMDSAAAILAGNPNHAEHWDKIAGYARITSERLDG